MNAQLTQYIYRYYHRGACQLVAASGGNCLSCRGVWRWLASCSIAIGTHRRDEQENISDKLLLDVDQERRWQLCHITKPLSEPFSLSRARLSFGHRESRVLAILFLPEANEADPLTRKSFVSIPRKSFEGLKLVIFSAFFILYLFGLPTTALECTNKSD